MGRLDGVCGARIVTRVVEPQVADSVVREEHEARATGLAQAPVGAVLHAWVIAQEIPRGTRW